MKYRYFLLLITGCLFWGCLDAFAQDDQGDVSTVLSTPSKDAVFSSKALYKFDVKNTYNQPQEGTISYLITTEKGDSVKNEVRKVNIRKKSSASYDFAIDGLKPGFYKVSFMINVSYYDDTTRKAFGIKPEEVRSSHPKPADFEAFWSKTKAELAAIPPDFKFIPLPDSTKDARAMYRFEMRSLDNVLVGGYLTIPVTKKKRKFAVSLLLPGYQVAAKPIMGDEPDLAIITLDIRGQGLFRGVINTRYDDYISYHIENKERYVMRGAIMDCLRAVEFIFSRPELDHDKIIVSGGSLGGYLAIATAALDSRVKLCSAQNPVMSDVQNLEGKVEWPLKDIKQYIKTQPGLNMQKVMNNLDYYDTKNFATMLKVSTLLGMGLLDHLVPPSNAYAVYNNINYKKHIFIFKDLGHEVGKTYVDYQSRWLHDTFGLF
nr:acetylxylan esterase [uncultured Mucilaginibacter sp.]